MRFRKQTSRNIDYRKTRKRADIPRQARELTFSCYRGFAFLSRDRTRHWFIEALARAREAYRFDLWAYVLMPEHVHLLIYPEDEHLQVGFIAGKIKEEVARRAIEFMKENSPEWLARITVREGKLTRHRFWQAGGGYDRNVIDQSTLKSIIDYFHMNPVRRGLVARPEDWIWSSAGWYAGIEPVPIAMDATLPIDHNP